jgi:selenocysteine-specific elongation factor
VAPAPAHIVDVAVEMEEGEPPLEPGVRIHVHHGTRESPGRVYSLGGGYAQLRLDTPIVAERGDRVILRRLAPPDTIGGGVVVDPNARRHGPRPQVVERLRALEAGKNDVTETPNPQKRVRPLVEGSASAPEPAPAPDAAALRVAELLRSDGERPRTDAELAEAAGLDARAAAAAFTALERAGLAVRVARSLHFDPTVLAGLTKRVVGLCERDGSATIAGVRDELDTSRKYAQALLEHLDAQKVTLRRGDEHVLRPRR